TSPRNRWVFGGGRAALNDLESELGISPNLEQLDLAVSVQGAQLWRGVGMVAAWELQSQLATMVMVGLVAMVSVWMAFAVMLGWSLVATFVYYHARRYGLPDLLDQRSTEKKARRKQSMTGAVIAAVVSAIKLWLVGLQAFVYSRTFCRVLNYPAA